MASGPRQGRKRKRTQSQEPLQDASLATIPGRYIHNSSHALTTFPILKLESVTGYTSLKEYRSYLYNLTSRSEQYDALWNFAQVWIAQKATSDQVAEILDDLVIQLNLHDMMKDNKSDIWSQVTSQANVARIQRSDRDNVREKVCNKLGRENVKRDFIGIWDDTLHTWKYLHSLVTEKETRNFQYNDLKRSILQVQLRRLLKPKRGTSNSVMIVAKDLKDARELLRTGQVKAEGELNTDVIAAGYGISATGFICLPENVIGMLQDGVHVTSIEYKPKSCIMEIDNANTNKTSDTVQDCPADCADLPSEGEQEIDLDDSDGQDLFDEYECSEGLNSSADEVEDASWDDDNSKKRRIIRKCDCTEEIPMAFTEQLEKYLRPSAITQSLIIKNWYRHQKVGTFCFIHTRRTVTALGMKSKSHNRKALNKLLMQYHTAVINNKLGDFKSDEDTYHYFHVSARPERSDDSLGVYKYAHNKLSVNFAEADQRILQRDLHIDVKTWQKMGSINMDGMIWWKSGDYIHDSVTIFDVAVLEFEMYDYHLRAVNNNPNYGWLRCMYHSLVQQVMRQDPWYWMVYVALRGDLKHDLVSYPYYAKYQHEGDRTFFRHIDINLPRLIENDQGLYQIQGTLSLDDERDEDCTQILPGMHKYVEEWTVDLLKRPGLKLGAAIHNIGSKEYTEEDEMKYAISWTSVPCRALQVRITDPRVPHGAMGPAKGIRRTMLPWYVALQTGLHHLEIGEAGTFDDLAEAHRNLSQGPRSPSGLPNRYGKIPYSFPAAIPLTGLGVLSDALVCRCRHDSPPVIALKKQLLSGGPTIRDAYLHHWRKKAVVAVVEGWREVEKLEREYFGEKSWFRRRDMIARGDSVSDIVADVDENARDLDIGCHGHEDELRSIHEDAGDVADSLDQ